MTPEKVKVEISLMSVVKIIALLIGLWILYQVKDILLIMLVVVIIATAIGPFVNTLEKQGVPRSLSIIVLYLALLIGLGFFIYFVIQPIVFQMKEFALNLPYYQQKLSNINASITSSTMGNILDTVATRLSNASSSIFGAVFSVFGGFVSAITIFALTYYTLIDEKIIRKSLSSLVPADKKERFFATLQEVTVKLGNWLRGQLALMAVVGLMDGIALGIIGIPFALTLGLISGVLEIVPVIGPIVAGATAVLVGFISGAPLWKIVVTVIIYIAVQQLENHILVPKIMQKAVGLSPIIVILAILIGYKLLGFGGAILAVPIAAGISVFVKEYGNLQRSG